MNDGRFKIFCGDGNSLETSVDYASYADHVLSLSRNIELDVRYNLNTGGDLNPVSKMYDGWATIYPPNGTFAVLLTGKKWYNDYENGASIVTGILNNTLYFSTPLPNKTVNIELAYLKNL